MLGATGYDREAEEERQRAAVVAFMRHQLGKRYEFGVEVQSGHEEDAQSWDCSESVEAAFRTAGLSMPDGAQAQWDFCRQIGDPKAGDLGFMWSDTRHIVGHVMVFTGEETLVHAVGGRGVVEDPVERWRTNERFLGFRRHPDWMRPKEDRPA